MSPLLNRLVSIYLGEDIAHPHLRGISLAQWLLESARGTSDLATLHYNFGGLKFRKEMAGIATPVEYKAHDGTDKYCKFATLEHYIHGYWKFINRAPYTGWEAHCATPEEYIRYIGPIYTPSAGYADKVLALLPEANKLLDDARLALSNPPQPQSGGGGTVGSDLGTIVIDPGHGGMANMPGSASNHAISVSGVKEKKLALDFSFILRDEIVKALAKNEKVTVILTRETDKNLPGADRARMAFNHKAKIFLCLHFNGDPKPNTRGPETFYRAKENKNLNLKEDMAFAAAVQKALFDALFSLDPKTKDRGFKPDNQGNPNLPGFGVLNDQNLGNNERTDPCLAAYIEVEFITNPAVENLLISGPEAIKNRTLAMAAVAKAVVAQLRDLKK